MSPTPRALPPWVTDAAQLPLAFAQVREDALVDLAIVRQLGPDARVLMVASGGCTAAALAASGAVARLHLVDPNPAQIALARLKLRLVQGSAPERRLALLGHALMSPAERAEQLGTELAALGLAPDVLGPIQRCAEAGPDHLGRYERVFAELRRLLGPQPIQLARLLQERDPAVQAPQVTAEAILGQALDAALDEAMALQHLVALFTGRATRNPRLPFARHFAERTRHVLATSPAADNPYLWQMYAGRFPAGTVYPWLAAPSPRKWPSIGWSTTEMQPSLSELDGPFDLVHLSNILDWITEAEAGLLLERTADALRPGGLVLIRQLNSTLAIPPLGPAFDWQAADANRLHARDRSFFYRALHLGRKR
jgi:S-adenosylmethionine-diacylglycerol 3-amino-3-carboxypropyl transferase